MPEEELAPIDGLKRMRIPNSGFGPYHDTFFVFDLSVLRIVRHEPFRTTIPFGDLAHWIFTGGDPAGSGVGNELFHRLKDHQINADYCVFDAISPDRRSILRRLPTDHSIGPDAPVVLHLPTETFGLVQFNKEYDEALRIAEKSRLRHQTDNLENELGSAVDALKAAFKEREDVRKKIAPLMRKLNAGLTVIDMVRDFGKSKSERLGMWPASFEKRTATLADRKLDDEWRENARRFRNDWELLLIKPCIAIQNSEISTKKIETAAATVVDELRKEGAACVTMLENWEALCPAAQALYNNRIRTAFALCMQVTGARAIARRGVVRPGCCCGGRRC